MARQDPKAQKNKNMKNDNAKWGAFQNPLSVSPRRQDAPSDVCCVVTLPPLSYCLLFGLGHLTGEKRVLVAEILSAVGLAEAHDSCRVETARLGCAACCDAEAERDIGHAEDHAPGVLGAVIGPAAAVGFGDWGGC
jgi:hypothetical protein